MTSDEVRYTPTNEWCKLTDGLVVIGITAQALAAIGEVVFVELPEPGDDVLRELPFGEVEGTQDVKDLFSPLDGMVQEINSRLMQHPEELSKDPENAGWLIRLKPESLAAFDALLSRADYEDQLRRKRTR